MFMALRALRRVAPDAAMLTADAYDISNNIIEALPPDAAFAPRYAYAFAFTATRVRDAAASIERRLAPSGILP